MPRSGDVCICRDGIEIKQPHSSWHVHVYLERRMRHSPPPSKTRLYTVHPQSPICVSDPVFRGRGPLLHAKGLAAFPWSSILVFCFLLVTSRDPELLGVGRSGC